MLPCFAFLLHFWKERDRCNVIVTVAVPRWFHVIVFNQYPLFLLQWMLNNWITSLKIKGRDFFVMMRWEKHRYFVMIRRRLKSTVSVTVFCFIHTAFNGKERRRGALDVPERLLFPFPAAHSEMYRGPRPVILRGRATLHVRRAVRRHVLRVLPCCRTCYVPGIK